jgi:hypothetical protein
METAVIPTQTTFKWYEIWRDVLLHPNDETFQRILADPTKKSDRAALWLIVTAVISAIGSSVISRSPFIILTIILTPVFVLIDVFLSAALAHWGAGRSNGMGTRKDVFYVFAAISAPNLLLIVVLQILEVAFGKQVLLTSVLSLALSIYVFVLYVRTIHFVEKIGYVNSCLALIIPGLLLGLVIFGIVMVLTVLVAGIGGAH